MNTVCLTGSTEKDASSAIWHLCIIRRE